MHLIIQSRCQSIALSRSLAGPSELKENVSITYNLDCIFSNSLPYDIFS